MGPLSKLQDLIELTPLPLIGKHRLAESPNALNIAQGFQKAFRKVYRKHGDFSWTIIGRSDVDRLYTNIISAIGSENRSILPIELAIIIHRKIIPLVREYVHSPNTSMIIPKAQAVFKADIDAALQGYILQLIIKYDLELEF